MFKNVRIILFFFFFCSTPYALDADPPLGQEPSASLSGKYKDYNVILIIADAMRYDHLSCYGYAKETSPNIDQLAKHGVIFTNAFSQSHNTLGSVVSIFTSLYPSSHCVEHIFKDSTPDNIYTLADILNIYGYKTAWFGPLQDPHTSMSKNLLKGFNEVLDLHEGYAQIFNIIKKRQDEHFFITIHSYSTHENSLINGESGYLYDKKSVLFKRLESYYVKAWEKMYHTCKNNPEELDKIFGKGWSSKNAKYFALPYSDKSFNKIQQLLDSAFKRYSFNKIIKLGQKQLFFKTLNDEDLLILLSLLDDAIHGLDKDLIGGLIRELKENNLYDKTIIIITADHGNEYREHGHIGHQAYLYDEIIKVPLLFHIPFLNKAVKIGGLVQSIDILPTVLELLNIPAPYSVQGISLVGQIEGKPGAIANDYVFAKTIPGSFAIRSKQYKLIQKNTEDGNLFYEFYNLKDDPLERNNLIHTELGIADILKAELKSKLISLPKYNRKNSEFIPEIDSKTRERIKKTGYW